MLNRKPPPMSRFRVPVDALGELEHLADEIDGETSILRELDSEDPETAGRAAEQLLGRAVREAVRS